MNIVVMPILFEEQVLAVVELASLRAFSEVNRAFLEQLGETLGVAAERLELAGAEVTEYDGSEISLKGGGGPPV